MDSLFNSYTLAEKDKTLGSAADRTEALASEWSMKSYQTTDADNNIRKHEADWHKKITLSLSCLIFFFHRCAFGSHHPQRRFRNARSGIRLNFRNLLYH